MKQDENDVRIFIMAGGVGSRFWPKSRNNYPKQFIDILGTGKSLLQQTFERFSSYVDSKNIYVITNDDYQQLVAQQLTQLPLENIICEPSRNNTAPCIAYAAFKLNKENPDAVMVIVPSDHLILKEEAYAGIIEKAVNFAKDQEALVTLGIQPTRPDTGYGYIEFEENTNEYGINKVISFKEKPGIEKAQEYLDSGQYLWNAGMFIWRASVIIKSFEKLAPEIFEIFSKGIPYYNSTEERDFISTNYPLSPKISIDFSIIEKADNVFTIPADIGWSDLGTWNSLHTIYEQKDANNNAIIAKHIHLADAENCMINAPDDKLVVIDGLKDYIVVDNSNALLIYPKSKEQQIKEVTKYIGDNGLSEFL